mmetsp:Transcript_6311/g.12848  ORF Transcript_6311/g.12848 Transcript_6311/m.12848 type:complete len:214 (-) Transcript_6311:582-1223(-)
MVRVLFRHHVKSRHQFRVGLLELKRVFEVTLHRAHREHAQGGRNQPHAEVLGARIARGAEEVERGLVGLHHFCALVRGAVKIIQGTKPVETESRADLSVLHVVVVENAEGLLHVGKERRLVRMEATHAAEDRHEVVPRLQRGHVLVRAVAHQQRAELRIEVRDRGAQRPDRAEAGRRDALGGRLVVEHDGALEQRREVRAGRVACQRVASKVG